jgi:shikimate 5-dehydrogenase
MKENTTYTNTSKCPTQKALEQYVFSEMNSIEQHFIERHLLHCKICDDVVEGLMLLKDEQELAIAKQNINKKIDAFVDVKKNTNNSILAIAAGLALLVGLTFYFSKNNQKQLAEIKNVSKADSLILKADSVTNVFATKTESEINEQSDDAIVNIKTETAKQLASNFKSEKKAITKTPNVENLASDMEYETVAGNAETPVQFNAPIAAMPKQKIDVNEDLSSSKTVTDDSKLEEIVDVFAGKSAKKSTDVSPKIKAEAEAKAKAEAEAKAKPEAQERAKKEADLKAVLETSRITTPTTANITNVQPIEQNISLEEIQVMEAKSRKLDSFMQDYAIAKSNYKSGLKYYKANYFEKALKCYDIVLKYPKTKFFEDAQLQKAKCLIGSGKKEDAKILLQNIINQNGKNKQEAETIMLTIDN